jgi:hypothetical protein
MLLRVRAAGRKSRRRGFRLTSAVGCALDRPRLLNPAVNPRWYVGERLSLPAEPVSPLPDG